MVADGRRDGQTRRWAGSCIRKAGTLGISHCGGARSLWRQSACSTHTHLSPVPEDQTVFTWIVSFTTIMRCDAVFHVLEYPASSGHRRTMGALCSSAAAHVLDPIVWRLGHRPWWLLNGIVMLRVAENQEPRTSHVQGFLVLFSFLAETAVPKCPARATARHSHACALLFWFFPCNSEWWHCTIVSPHAIMSPLGARTRSPRNCHPNQSPRLKLYD